MKLKQISLNIYDYGATWEEGISQRLKGCTHVHTKDLGKDKTVIYAFYPDEEMPSHYNHGIKNGEKIIKSRRKG